jgi:hemolysin III
MAADDAEGIDHLRPREEIVDVAILFTAVALSILGLGFLWVRAAGDAAASAAVAVYGATLIASYLAAGSFRIARGERSRSILQAIDHCSICLLIAGTYTPFALVALRSHGGTVLFAAVWLMAVAGIGVRLVAHWRLLRLLPILCLVQGWFGLAWAGALIETVGYGALALIVAGGIAYSSGLAFYVRAGSRFANVYWHLAVMAGSVLHYAAIALFVVPR